MLYQQFVSFYPGVSQAGEQHNDHRHTAIWRSGVSLADDVIPGTALIVTGSTDHTRLVVENPTAANAVAPNSVVFNGFQAWKPNSYTRNYIGEINTNAGTTNTNHIYRAGEQLHLLDSGIMYIICEKAIDPSNPVYIRVAAPDASGLQGIGFATDTPDGGNTVLVPDASFYGIDALTYIQELDASVTQAQEQARCSMPSGYSIAPVSLRFNQRASLA